MFSPSLPGLRRAAVLLLVALLATACGADTADTAASEPVGTADPSTADTAGADTAATAQPEVADTGTADAAGSADVEAAAPTENLTDGCATDPAADVDWFPQQASFDVATGISATYDGNVKLVTIDRPSDAPDVEPYTLAMVQCGTDAGDVEADAVVEVPITAAATYSTTFVQGFELIDRIDAISAHGGLQFVSSEALLAAADAGEVVEVGDQTAPDLEALAAADPDVILASAGFSGADATEPFAALDIPVVPNASFLETDPLARAEWMKLEAMLLNEEGAATEVFDQIAADYTELTDLAADAGERPTVLTNAPFEGTWFVGTGDSYTATLIAAAGGEYVFDDLEGPTTPLDLEVVLADAQDADVWLSAGSVRTPAEDLLAVDERLGEFAAYPDAVWADDADVGPSGGNRIYEDGAVRPDLVLADVIAILHPDLLPDHELRFYGLIGSAADGAAAGAAGGGTEASEGDASGSESDGDGS